MRKTGSCLCGAVSFEIDNIADTTTACHCGMCRKWSGGVYLGLKAKQDKVRFKGKENVTTYTSSDWAERGFCKICGSSLFCRITAEGPHSGDYHFGLGTLDDPSGITLDEEMFIDQKPDGYAFANETRKFTRAEVFAMYDPPD